MRYQRVAWLHDFSDEPVVIYSELDADGWEHRKVDEFRDGRLTWANKESDLQAETLLSESQVPSLDEINADPQFAGVPMSPDLFEEVWDRARRPTDT